MFNNLSEWWGSYYRVLAEEFYSNPAFSRMTAPCQIQFKTTEEPMVAQFKEHLSAWRRQWPRK